MKKIKKIKTSQTDQQLQRHSEELGKVFALNCNLIARRYSIANTTSNEEVDVVLSSSDKLQQFFTNDTNQPLKDIKELINASFASTSVLKETISNISGDVKGIFMKISEQLEDPIHPLVQICTSFHKTFIRDVDEVIEYQQQCPDEAELVEICKDQIAQVKQFLYILYGSCVRFYSTVVEWVFLNEMKEDLIELLTSLVFKDPYFS